MSASDDAPSARPDPAQFAQDWTPAAVTRLVAAFYRQVPTDDLLAPLYPPHDWPAAEQRLRDFLIFRCGGPQQYLQQRGHPRLRLRHAPFAINGTVRDRWVQLMDHALDEVLHDPTSGVSEEAVHVLRTFLHESATMLVNR
jgi:hemoglobin